MHLKRFDNNQGVVLAIALMFIALLSAISAAILIYMYNNTSINYKEVRRLKALYACEAAMNYAYHALATGQTHDPNLTITDTDGVTIENVDISVINNGTITCSATY